MSKRMTPGKLRLRLVIQSKTVASDGMGAAGRETWTDTYPVWGNIEPLSGIEGREAMEMRGEISHEITIRFRKNVTVRNRIKFVDIQNDQTLYYNIRSVLNLDQRNQYLQIRAEETVIL